MPAFFFLSRSECFKARLGFQRPSNRAVLHRCWPCTPLPPCQHSCSPAMNAAFLSGELSTTTSYSAWRYSGDIQNLSSPHSAATSPTSDVCHQCSGEEDVSPIAAFCRGRPPVWTAVRSSMRRWDRFLSITAFRSAIVVFFLFFILARRPPSTAATYIMYLINIIKYINIFISVLCFSAPWPNLEDLKLHISFSIRCC